jgi:hypothetical protein
MFAETRNHLDAGVLPLWNAVFCLDCEVISSSRGDECSACKSRSLVSLARMLEGSLLAHRAQHSHECESGLFDITIAVELQQMHAKDLSTTVERLTSVIGPKLARDRALIPHQCEAGSRQTRPTALALLPGTGCRIEHCYYLASSVNECNGDITTANLRGSSLR